MEDDAWATYRADGSLAESLDRLAFVEPCNTIIGHSRLATTGTYAGGAPQIEDTMPFIVDDVAIVHNGNVRNWRMIAYREKIELKTGCDSEIIAHLVARERVSDETLTSAVNRAMVMIDDGRPFALIAVSSDGQIAGAHRDLPLYVANADEGMYFCSRRPTIENATVVMSPPLWGWPGAWVNDAEVNIEKEKQ